MGHFPFASVGLRIKPWERSSRKYEATLHGDQAAEQDGGGVEAVLFPCTGVLVLHATAWRNPLCDPQCVGGE